MSKSGRPPKYTMDIVDKINKLIRAGLTVSEAAEAVGLNNIANVYQITKRLNLHRLFVK